jgi:hypothetical protein
LQTDIIEKEKQQIIELPVWNNPKDLDNAKMRIYRLGVNMHQHAYLVGKDLLWVKEKVGHGNFLDWVDTNVWFGERTAENFMKFADRCDEQNFLIEYHPRKLKSATVADLKWLRFTTVWTFRDRGDFEGLSNLPTDMVRNVLYYYTEKGDKVGDPFAGSGLTGYVCDDLKRKAVMSDIKPQKEEIIKKDIRDGYHDSFKDSDLIFLDPPYWNMIQYGENSLDTLSYDDFIQEMERLASNTKEILKDNGHVALVIMPIHNDGEFYDLGFECEKIFSKYFKIRERLCVPVIKEPHPLEEKRMMYTLRDLIIFKKEDKKDGT